MRAAPVLVVGATGQLGTAVVDRLAKAGARVRALVRPRLAARLRLGRRRARVRRPARAGEPRRGVPGHGHASSRRPTPSCPRGPAPSTRSRRRATTNLLDACRAEGVRRIVFMSVPRTPRTTGASRPSGSSGRSRSGSGASGLAYSIFRGSLFMDDWFALMGSSIPLRGAEAAHAAPAVLVLEGLPRAWPARSIERRGIALVPGDGKTRHAFVALDDVAAILAAAAAAPEDGEPVEDLGGPRSSRGTRSWRSSRGSSAGRSGPSARRRRSTACWPTCSSRSRRRRQPHGA